MKIFIKVKTGAREDKIEEIGENNFLVSVKARPVKGRANIAVERAVAGHFGIPVSRVKIVSGLFSKKKILEVKSSANEQKAKRKI